MFDFIDVFRDAPWRIWKAAAEIILIAAVIYVFLGYIRSTRGAGILRGLTVVIFCAFLATQMVVQRLGLDNVSWLMGQAMATLAVGVIVIMQPEIRQGFMRIGETIRLFAKPGATVDREIADAAVQIAKRRDMGILIAIERKVPLTDYTHSGIRLDAELSSPLLRTIFTKNSPLHDGAVVVRQGRIASANCLLPMSENVETCRGMGTRHRAALGLSEETDALTVVVSEETGGISVTLGGRIHRDLDYERLRALLKETCGDAWGGAPKEADAAAADLPPGPPENAT